MWASMKFLPGIFISTPKITWWIKFHRKFKIWQELVNETAQATGNQHGRQAVGCLYFGSCEEISGYSKRSVPTERTASYSSKKFGFKSLRSCRITNRIRKKFNLPIFCGGERAAKQCESLCFNLSVNPLTPKWFARDPPLNFRWVLDISERALPWSQRLSCILYWQILRREPLLLIVFIGTKRWEPRKESLWSRPLGTSLSCHQLLTVVSDWRIFLIALRVIWLDGWNIFGDGSGVSIFLFMGRCGELLLYQRIFLPGKDKARRSW